MQKKMKKTKKLEDLIRTDITIISLFDKISHQERILSARCISRNNISHRKSLFEKRMNEFLEGNYTVDYMASRCNMSVTAFKKKFSEYYKSPPHRWIVKQHLHKSIHRHRYAAYC